MNHIINCSRRICLCVEYLSINCKKDIKFYKNCIKNNETIEDISYNLNKLYKNKFFKKEIK